MINIIKIYRRLFSPQIVSMEEAGKMYILGIMEGINSAPSDMAISEDIAAINDTLETSGANIGDAQGKA